MKVIIIDENNFMKNQNQFEDMIYLFYKENGSNFMRGEVAIADMVMNKDVFYACAVEEGKIVCLCRAAKMVDRKTHYAIRQIDTLESYRGKGYAGSVLEKVSSYVKARGGKKIFSLADVDNYSSIKMHEKSGYQIIQPNETFKKTFYYWEGAHVFEKELENEI